MREWNENTVTEEVVRRFDDAPPRLRQVMTALTRHLHDFIREVELTEAEWMAAIEFLTRTGQTCSDTRQEFILLSDTLGASILVDALNHRTAPGATRSTVLGPFFVEAAPEAANGAHIDRGGAGEKLLVEAAIQDTEGRPIAGATVDVWHADNEGFYDVQREGDALSHRARFTSDAEGRVRFWTDMPVSYPVPDDGPVGDMLKATGRHPWRPAHVHFMVAAPGHQRLVTHIFVAGDPYLDSDVVFAVKDALIGDFVAMPAGSAHDGGTPARPYRRLDYTFGLQRDAA